jgi:hypothetical protein
MGLDQVQQTAVRNCSAQKGRPRGNLEALEEEFGLDPGVLQQPWSELSVSELAY